MENFYDMSRFNKKSVESNVRIQNQTAEFLKLLLSVNGSNVWL